MDGWMDGWIDHTVYVIFNSISVISGRWAGDHKILSVLEPRLKLKISSSLAGSNTRSRIIINFVVAVLLFYVHGKHLRSCRDGQLT